MSPLPGMLFVQILAQVVPKHLSDLSLYVTFVKITFFDHPIYNTSPSTPDFLFFILLHFTSQHFSSPSVFICLFIICLSVLGSL